MQLRIPKRFCNVAKLHFDISVHAFSAMGYTKVAAAPLKALGPNNNKTAPISNNQKIAKNNQKWLKTIPK